MYVDLHLWLYLFFIYLLLYSYFTLFYLKSFDYFYLHVSIHTLNIISHTHVHRYIQHFPNSQLRWLGSSYDLSLLQVKKRKEDPFVSESLFPKIDHEFLAMSSHQQHELLCFGEAARKVMARQEDGNLDQREGVAVFHER